ncbi:hypothetical protein BC937DRAFT_89826, partial [Endogone sp. FLAS-F59071]
QAHLYNPGHTCALFSQRSLDSRVPQHKKAQSDMFITLFDSTAFRALVDSLLLTLLFVFGFGVFWCFCLVFGNEVAPVDQVSEPKQSSVKSKPKAKPAFPSGNNDTKTLKFDFGHLFDAKTKSSKPSKKRQPLSHAPGAWPTPRK